MNFAIVGNTILHYQHTPTSPTVPLVFLNSLGSDLRIWDGVVTQLQGRHPIVRYDKRGHGLSDAPPGPYSLTDHGADLLGLLDHLAIAQAVLIGVSVGGMIAQQIAITHPQRVAAMVLCDTGAKIGTADYWIERATAVRKGGLEPLVETILPRWFSAGFAQRHPAAYRGYANMLTRMPREGYAATCDALRDADLRDQVAAIAAPTLLLCGDEDLATPPALGQALAAAMPNARFAMIEQAGHIPSIEQPTAVAAQITQFLKEINDDH